MAHIPPSKLTSGPMKLLYEEIKKAKASHYFLDKEAGLSRGYVSRILSGQLRPGIDVYEALANSLGLTISLVPLQKEEKE